MGANIRPVPVAGVGGETSFVAALFDAEGRPRPFDDVAAELGYATATLTFLDQSMGVRLSKPRARGYPPKVFISYRRESASHVQWCRELAAYLQDGLGFEVDLDDLRLRGNSPQDVVDYISRLADADATVVIITPSYLRGDTPNSMRDWIFEEWSRIQALEQWGVLEVILVIREGDPAELWGGFSNTRYAAVDLRGAGEDFSALGRLLGRYRGPRISDTERKYLASGSAQVIEFAEAGALTLATKAFQALERFAGTEEYYIASVAHVLLERRTLAAERQILPPPCELSLASAMLAGHLLWLFDWDLEAFPYLAEVSEAPNIWRHNAHFLMGDIFQSSERIMEAINHFNWCVMAHDSAALGGVYSSSPVSTALAAARLAILWRAMGDDTRSSSAAQRAMELAPEESEVKRLLGEMRRVPLQFATPPVGLECGQCGALSHESLGQCVLCGSQDRAQTDCEFCRYPVLPTDRLLFCPTCRRGPGPGSNTVNFHLVQREVGGRFSVFAAGNWVTSLPTDQQ